MGQICTSGEIRALEDKNALTLPIKYKEFLLNGDAVFEEVMAGSDFHPPYLEKLNDWAKDLLEEDGNPCTLKVDDFVFCMHQGYQFLYFNCSEDSDDPPVYYYLEGDKSVTRVANSFTQYIAATKRSQESESNTNN